MVREGYKEVRIGPKDRVIPEEWKVNKLKNIISKRKGKRPNRLYESKNDENLIPYLSVNYLRGNDLPEWCSKDDDNKVEVKENEILMIWDGSYSGNVFIGFNGALSSTMARLKCKNEINNKYLFYQLRNNFKVFQSTTIGTSVPHVAGKIFENLNIPTPEKKEQKKIASILSSVDSTIEKTDEVIEETKELKKGLMQELLTKGIGHSEFKEVRLGVKTYTVPVNWKVTTIEEITNGKPRYGANSSAKDFNPNLPRYVRITDLSEDGFLKNDDKKSIPINEADSYYLEKGDIVFARSGATVGKTYIYDPKDGLCAYAGYLIRFKINTEKVIPKYLLNVTHSYYYSAWVKSMIRATSQPNINSKEYASFDLLLPPLEEQKKIASILSSVDAKIQKEEEYKAKLERLKKGLMQKLLTGEIRVNTEMEV